MSMELHDKITDLVRDMEVQKAGLKVWHNTPDPHVWCGPAVLSAALGIYTSEANDLIKMISLRKNLKAVTYVEMEHALSYLHVRYNSYGYSHVALDCPLLQDWIKDRNENCTYLVCVTGHWIAIRGDHWADNMNRDGRPMTQMLYNNTRVRHVIQIDEEQPALRTSPEQVDTPHNAVD